MGKLQLKMEHVGGKIKMKEAFFLFLLVWSLFLPFLAELETEIYCFILLWFLIISMTFIAVM